MHQKMLFKSFNNNNTKMIKTKRQDKYQRKKRIGNDISDTSLSDNKMEYYTRIKNNTKIREKRIEIELFTYLNTCW